MRRAIRAGLSRKWPQNWRVENSTQRHFGMRPQEVMKRVQQMRGAFPIVFAVRKSNVVDDHIAHFFQTVRSVAEIGRDGRCNNVGHMFMIGDRVDLLLREPAQTNTILQTDHVVPLLDRQ